MARRFGPRFAIRPISRLALALGVAACTSGSAPVDAGRLSSPGDAESSCPAAARQPTPGACDQIDASCFYCLTGTGVACNCLPLSDADMPRQWVCLGTEHTCD
jgi:hypothetical protein